jgi:hypothetical protein
MNIGRNNPTSSQRLGLASTTTYQDNKAIRKVGSLEARFIFHYETNQCSGFLI